uniref:F-box domain-containing protein n=1 Tax=Meloidogyne javanica TaxID=6303 RepID=A0A915MAC0_MELJA
MLTLFKNKIFFECPPTSINNSKNSEEYSNKKSKAIVLRALYRMDPLVHFDCSVRHDGILWDWRLENPEVTPTQSTIIWPKRAIYKLRRIMSKNRKGNAHISNKSRKHAMYLITTMLPGTSQQQNGHTSNFQQQQKHNHQHVPTALINRMLPTELILRVFSYLDITSLCRCAQVCRSWNKLSMDGSNWMDVDLFLFQREVKTAVVESLAKRCGNFLKVLSLKGCENVQDNAMSEGCKRLEELNISWCEQITDLGLFYIAKNCNNLKTLFCKGLENITSNCFANLEMAELRRLSLHSCPNVLDETINDIARHCPRLEFLSLSNCKEITDLSLVAISQGCPRLKDIELAGCINLTDAGFIQLSKNCHELERMDLEECLLITDITISNLNNGCPNLLSLSLSHCENLTDIGLAELCASHKDRIQVLELDNCPNITDNTLESMKMLQVLERIDLYDCQMITKDAIKKFKLSRPDVEVHAYFAPATPPPQAPPVRRGICRCCAIL